MTLRPLASALALLTAACATTPRTAAADPQLSLDTLKSVTQTLSSDEFEGRAPTTPGEEKTVRLIAERFQQAGLQPGLVVRRAPVGPFPTADRLQRPTKTAPEPLRARRT